MKYKNRNLRIVFFLFCVSLLLPMYYIASILTEGVFLRKFINDVIKEKSSIEYFNFIGLEGVLNENFGNKQYTVYVYADSTKGLGAISRNNLKQLTIENTEIYNAHGTAVNEITKDVYNFESKLMNVSQQKSAIRLYQDFNIRLKKHKEDTILEMRGDNIVFNTKNGSIESDAPVMMQGEDSILIGGNFLFQNNVVTMKGDVFIDSPNIILTADLLKITLDGDKHFTKNSEVFFKTAVFSGKTTMFDKINNVKAFARKITIDYNKKLAILEGNAKIERNGSVATGSMLTYNLDSGVANLKNNQNSRVKLVINY